MRYFVIILGGTVGLVIGALIQKLGYRMLAPSPVGVLWSIDFLLSMVKVGVCLVGFYTAKASYDKLSKSS